MTGRSRIGKSYVQRDRRGRFKKWTRVGRSLRQDRKVKSPTKPKKSGHGHRGDY